VKHSPDWAERIRPAFTARDVMRKDVIVVDECVPLPEILRQVPDAASGPAVVVDAWGKVVGLVTRVEIERLERELGSDLARSAPPPSPHPSHLSPSIASSMLGYVGGAGDTTRAWGPRGHVSEPVIPPNLPFTHPSPHAESAGEPRPEASASRRARKGRGPTSPAT
jgi:CBS domain-containing protein